MDDCGRILNPMLVRGQVHGGLAQGIAQALYEEVRYDDDANPITGNLTTYLMPSAAEFPSFETAHTETPDAVESLGGQGDRGIRLHRIDAGGAERRRGRAGAARRPAPRPAASPERVLAAIRAAV